MFSNVLITLAIGLVAAGSMSLVEKSARVNFVKETTVGVTCSLTVASCPSMHEYGVGQVVQVRFVGSIRELIGRRELVGQVAKAADIDARKVATSGDRRVGVA